MLGGDLDLRIVVVVELGLLIFVGDDTTLYFRIGGLFIALLYIAKPGLVVNDSSPYCGRQKRLKIHQSCPSNRRFIRLKTFSHLFLAESQRGRMGVRRVPIDVIQIRGGIKPIEVFLIVAIVVRNYVRIILLVCRCHIVWTNWNETKYGK